MEASSTPPCPNTITLRRNPYRRARPTPATSALKPLPCSLSPPPNFPIDDILSMQLPQNPKPQPPVPENLQVFLRIRPNIETKLVKAERKNAWPRKPGIRNELKMKKKMKSEACVSITDDHSVTLCPPKALLEVKRAKSEVFEGFSHVFSADSSQVEVFDKMVKPLVDDFLRGRSGMLAALGPSGSGKTHTVFGSPREPGMVPQALGQIFPKDGLHKISSSRTFYLSMFEICSEKGKAERLCDLLQDGGDLCLQQSAIRGLQEVLISDIQQAECFIARGMLKRATAMTNSNSQSSRSQCVINIRTVENKIDEEVDVQLNSMLTIVDLAGAERERKTGNQGARLLESNFINNTSMVFGLCLRSLLEHQKNPKKPLQKHFQSSLLTRYLREYLEGKKRMALILTVKSGEEDYLDSSLLLRQASPYMKIKFDNVEESANLLCNKRHKQTFPRTEQQKRMKFTPEECVNNSSKGVGDQLRVEEGEKAKQIAPPHPVAHAKRTSSLEMSNYLEGSSIESTQQERERIIMQKFAKALWNVLKQYKMNLEVAENQIHNLTESLADEKTRRSELEIELKDLKDNHSCWKETSLVNQDSIFSSGSEEQISSQQTDVVHDLSSYNTSSSVVDNSECQGQSYQETKNQIQNTRESLADENARSSELKLELKDIKGSLLCRKEICLGKEVSFSGNKFTEQDGLQEIDDVRNLDSSIASSIVVDNSESQGQSYHYQVAESVDKNARRAELEIELKDVNVPLSCQQETSSFNKHSFSSDRSVKQDGSPEADSVYRLDSHNASSSGGDHSESRGQNYHYQVAENAIYVMKRDQVTENQIQNVRETLADENAGLFELKIELKGAKGPLSCWKETSSANENSFSGNRSAVQDGCREIDDIYGLDSCNASSSFIDNSESQGQGYHYQVIENHTQNVTESLAGCLELEIDLKDVKVPLSCRKETSSVNEDSFSGKRSTEQYVCREIDDIHDLDSCNASSLVVDNSESLGQSYNYQVAKIGAENSRHSELEIELKDVKSPISYQKETCLVNLDSFSGNGSKEQDGCLEIDVRDLDSRIASSSVIDNSESQCTDQECGGFLGEADCTEALTDLKDAGKGDSQFKAISGHSQPHTSSPEPLTITKENNCRSAEKNKMHGEEYEGQPSVKTMEAKVRPGCDGDITSKSEKKSRASCKPSNVDKPKRRLVPASSVLLKDLGGLNFEDENQKPKGTKGDKKWATNERNITQGSLSLLRLLNSKLRP